MSRKIFFSSLSFQVNTSLGLVRNEICIPTGPDKFPTYDFGRGQGRESIKRITDNFLTQQALSKS